MDDPKPLVIMASPGMLQNGLSRDLFVHWSGNPLNGIIFTGYAVEGTLAKQVMNGPTSILVGTQTVQIQ
jgi:cleavage and polyadenylation specificity factor subunit 3